MTPATVEDGGEIDESLDLEDLEGNAWTETYDEEWTCRRRHALAEHGSHEHRDSHVGGRVGLGQRKRRR